MGKIRVYSNRHTLDMFTSVLAEVFLSLDLSLSEKVSMSFEQSEGKQNIPAFALHGEWHRAQPTEKISNTDNLDLFRVFLVHSLVGDKLASGFSADRRLALGYVFRSLSLHPDLKNHSPQTIKIDSELQGNTEIFWYALIAREYFSLLSEVSVPLDTEDTYEVSYWQNVDRAEIQIASSLEEAVAHIEQKTKPERVVLTKSEPDVYSVHADGDLIAKIGRTATKHYREIAGYS